MRKIATMNPVAPGEHSVVHFALENQPGKTRGIFLSSQMTMTNSTSLMTSSPTPLPAQAERSEHGNQGKEL